MSNKILKGILYIVVLQLSPCSFAQMAPGPKFVTSGNNLTNASQGPSKSVAPLGTKFSQNAVRNRLAVESPAQRNKRLSQDLSPYKGVVNSAGGLMINGRPLEDFAVNPTTMIGWHEFVEPTFSQVSERFPDLPALFQEAALNMTWYLVPISMEKLSGNNQGVPFDSFDQCAIDNKFSEVFISSICLAEQHVTAERVGMLLFHESIMGFILYEKGQQQSNEQLPELHARTRRAGVILKDELESLPIWQAAEKLAPILFMIPADDEEILQATREAEENFASYPYKIRSSIDGYSNYQRDKVKYLGPDKIHLLTKSQKDIILASVRKQTDRIDSTESECPRLDFDCKTKRLTRPDVF